MRVVGLLLNFGGIVLLFLFEMAFRVASGSKTVAWTAPSIDVQVRKLDDIYTVLGWIGLLTLVLGTLLQILAALPAVVARSSLHDPNIHIATPRWPRP